MSSNEAILGERHGSAECRPHATPVEAARSEEAPFPPKASTALLAPLPSHTLVTRSNPRSPMPKSRPLRPFTITTNSQGKRNASPGAGPPSPTFTETTNVSAVNLGENGPAKIITRSDLKASMQSYENVSSALLCFVCGQVQKVGKLRLICALSLSPPSFLLFRFHSHNKHVLALEFMFQFPICSAYNVPGYRHVRRRNGILRRVSAVLHLTNSSICLASPE
jgi:hypothetical protein